MASVQFKNDNIPFNGPKYKKIISLIVISYKKYINEIVKIANEIKININVYWIQPKKI